MTNDIISIKYSAVNPGTEKTDILFYNETTSESIAQSLISENTTVSRIFVTDTTVAALPLMESFVKYFGITPSTPPKQNAVYQSAKDVLLVIGPGESFKTIENVLLIVKTALQNNLQRSSVFIGIGGGVICDMTAFAASIFKRGANLELIPTTLLAMVDAAVGGKTGCDFDSYKNMIGSFFPAKRLHIFSGFVQSLPDSEYRSGLAETLKTALLYAPKLFDIMENQQEDVEARKTDVVHQIIRRCVIAKANIVEKDLTEKGPRMQLNFGHTFAHALESCAGLGTIPHGDAVAWGIGRALDLSLGLGLCEKEYKDQVFAVLKAYGWKTEGIHPVLLQNKKEKAKIIDALISAMKKDKKNSSNSIRFILQRDINLTVIQEVADSDIIEVLSE
ncbi:MAG: 3-dehydroquinate synthase [Spirochaetaceae bacterium]|nr:3-dehydroquinate synthase [Spirochaetaceae bacterium]